MTTKLPSSYIHLGHVVQVQKLQTSTIISTSSQIPSDNTIPQISEGAEILSLPITPKSASNILIIRIDANFQNSVSAVTPVIALFKDSGPSAICAKGNTVAGVAWAFTMSLEHSIVAGSTSSQVFSVRMGSNSGGTLYNNGYVAADLWGAIPKSAMTILEIAA